MSQRHSDFKTSRHYLVGMPPYILPMPQRGQPGSLLTRNFPGCRSGGWFGGREGL